MTALLVALLAAVRSSLRSRREPAAEILALRHQLAVLQRQGPKRPPLGWTDRRLWVLLSRLWPNWRQAVQIVQPATVVRWHRRWWRLYWRWKSRRQRPGRPPHPASRASAHPPDVPGQPDLGCYLVRRRRPPSLTWRTFLRNHVGQLASVDFFVVPTPTCCRVLFVFAVLAHERRQIVHVNVTEHPTAAWTAQ